MALLWNCFATALLDLGHVDAEEPGGDADVDHVHDEAAQLAVGHELEDELLEGDGVEVEVVPERVELQALLVDDGGARVGRADVLVRRLRVHADEDVDVAAARDEARPATRGS